MGLYIPPEVDEDILVTQFASGYQWYGFTKDGELKEGFEADDGSALRIEVKGFDQFELNTKADYDLAVEQLKGKGWSDERIAAAFKKLNVDRDELDEEANEDEDDEG